MDRGRWERSVLASPLFKRSGQEGGSSSCSLQPPSGLRRAVLGVNYGLVWWPVG